MSDLRLVIGDRNLSSWSLRAWLPTKQSQLPFEEILIPLDQPETRDQLRSYSPSLKVPCLIHKNLQIWDSLAICEYLHELAPNQNLWPKNPQNRALARSYVSEMHSGFQALRSQLSMDIRLKIDVRHLTPATIGDIERILFLWEQALQKFNGPFLFGDFGIADAFYAPVVLRFQSYGVKITKPLALEYMKCLIEHPDVSDWVQKAKMEIYKRPSF